MLEFKVNKEFVGSRLDTFIRDQNNELLYSRSLIDKVIEDKMVSVNLRICSKKSHPLKEGDVVKVSLDSNFNNKTD